jgi:hypothetical protein
VLLSAPDAAIYAGPGWWTALIEAAREAVPNARFSSILDCGDDPGAAMAAIRAGTQAVIFTGRADVAERLAAIGEAANCRVLRSRAHVTSGSHSGASPSDEPGTHEHGR